MIPSWQKLRRKIKEIIRVNLCLVFSTYLKKQKLKNDIDGIVVAKGPGSYTGVRIGVTTAKTLAYALNTKLYGVSSLAALAATVKNDKQKLLVPIIDARREAVYTGVYQNVDGNITTIIKDQYLPIEELKSN